MEEMNPVVRQENDEDIKPEPSHWYEGHISLEDAKTFIKSNITTAARSFIAIGFYLKCVRDRELFAEDNYQDVWDFAKSEYGISKSTASRYMSMNDRFSENGNSPNIKTEYRAFGKSQLQEMLYLEDEQLDQVKPGDRVEDIRNLRKPKEIPYIELPGQLEFEIDFPQILPQEQTEQPMISQKQTFEMNVEDLLSGEEQESVAISQQESEENNQDFEEKRKREWLTRCEILRQMCNALCDMNSYGLEKDNYSMTSIQRISSGSYGFGFGDGGSEHSKYNVEYKKSRYQVEEFDGIGSWVFESGEIDQQIWNFNGREWHNAHPDQQKQETSQEDTGYYNPDDEKEVDESYSFAGIPKASDRHVTMLARLFVQDNAKKLIFGGVAIGITDERIIEMLKLFYHSQKLIIIDNDVQVTVCAEIIEFSRGDEDLGICLFQKFANYVRKQIDEYVADRLAEEDHEVPQEQQLVKHQEGNTFNSTPTKCPHREGYSCTVLTEKKSIPGDGSNCGSSCCWTCKFQGMCKFECNASAGRDGAIPEYDAAWFVNEWGKRVPEELQGVLKECKEQENNSDRAKAVQKYLAPYGYHGTGCGEYDFTYHGFAGGIDLKIGKVDTHLKYGRFVQELMNLFPGFEEPVREAPESVPKEDENVPEFSENVIDGEYVEIKEFSGVKAFDVTILNELIKREEGTLEQMAGIWKEKQPLIYTKHAMMFEAYNLLKDNNAKVEQKPEKQEQPELPILKNNDQRAAFIDAYETWPIWIETKETGERYYRYDLSEKAAIVVKVYWKHSWESYKESKNYEYGAMQYYLLGVKSEWRSGKNAYVEDESRTFYECGTNRSALVEYLKDFQKSK